MVEFQLRADDVEIQGKVVAVWALPPDLLAAPLNWHVMVQLPSGDARLVTADGKVNQFDYLECLVTPTSPYRDLPYATRLLSDLQYQQVRIRGSWGDRTVLGAPVSTLLSPIHWLVVDRDPSPFIEEYGFSQVVRDADVFVFSDDRIVDPGDTPPPHHREDRHADITIPFPGRPQTTTPPRIAECVDRDNLEQMIYFNRVNSLPMFPLHADRQHSFTIVPGPTTDSLKVSVDTGTPGSGKGFFYAKLVLAYDEPFAQMCDPNVCLVDPSRSCQATGETRHTYAWPVLESAHPGDLLLAPAGTAGILGALLGALDPGQLYDHTGMFVEDDRKTLRHCTALDKRIADPEYFSSTIQVATPFGHTEEKLPLAGIRHDILKYPWPGTITQTIGEVCYTGRNRSNPQFGFRELYDKVVLSEQSPPGNPPSVWLWQHDPAERDKRTAFHDPEAAATAKSTADPSNADPSKRKYYSLTRIQVEPAWRPEDGPIAGQPLGWIRPVVVQPHPQIAVAARQALKVAADEAKKISAHYRFYGYSDATIARNPAYNAPPEAGWAADSIAAVCSSYVWAAVQAANDVLAAQGNPVIELEGETENNNDRSSAGIDGLYQYTHDERREAAKALFKFTYRRVTDEVQKEIDGIGDLATALVTATGLGGTLATVKDLLGTIVSNQLVNTFAADNAADLGSTWQSTGDGRAVSPDDTRLWWDVSASIPNPPATPGRINVYGNQSAAAIPLPGWVSEPVYFIKESVGTGIEGGSVIRRPAPELAPEPVIGATVRLGCASQPSDVRGHFTFVNMKQGTYHLTGSLLVYDPAINIATEWKSIPELFDVNAGDNRNDLVVELLPPPAIGRNVAIRTHHDVVDRVTIGKDHWGHFDLDKDIPLVWDPSDAPGSPAAAAVPADERNTRLDGVFDQTTPAVGSGVCMRVEVHVRLEQVPGLNAPESITGFVICDIKLTFFDTEEGETNTILVDNNIKLGLGETHTLPYNFVSDDDVPERASGTVSITNHFAVF